MTGSRHIMDSSPQHAAWFVNIALSSLCWMENDMKLYEELQGIHCVSSSLGELGHEVLVKQLRTWADTRYRVLIISVWMPGVRDPCNNSTPETNWKDRYHYKQCSHLQLSCSPNTELSLCLARFMSFPTRSDLGQWQCRERWVRTSKRSVTFETIMFNPLWFWFCFFVDSLKKMCPSESLVCAH